MKISIIITFIILFTSISMASDSKFTKAMEKVLTELKEAKSVDQKQVIINKLERIASAEKAEWLPLYYISYSYINMSSQEKNITKKDQLLDKAQEYLDRAMNLKKEDSEIYTLQGYLYIRRLTIDPATRGQQYSGLAAKTLQKAKALNPDNPRSIFLLASLLHGTAQFFGQDTSEYCEMANLSLLKFEAYESKSDIYPNWGKSAAENFRSRSCNEK